MLLAEATRLGAGAILWGDHHDLRSLYDTVARSADAAPERMGDLIYGLCYDIRHAYQQQREEKKFGLDKLDSVLYQGVKILWPYVLLQAALVRHFAGFRETSKEDQANMFRLEHALTEALHTYDAQVAEECSAWMSTPPLLSNDSLPMFLDHLTYGYIAEGQGGKRRFRKLPPLLRSLRNSSPEYRAFKAELEQIAKKEGCEPQELRIERELPPFKW